MTHKKMYFLTFEGDPEIVAFLSRHVDRQQPDLATARAAKLLLGVRYKVSSVDAPRPTVERVRST